MISSVGFILLHRLLSLINFLTCWGHWSCLSCFLAESDRLELRAFLVFDYTLKFMQIDCVELFVMSAQQFILDLLVR